MIYSFDPITGEKVEGMPDHGLRQSYKLKQATLLSQMNDKFIRPLLVMDTQQNVTTKHFTKYDSYFKTACEVYVVGFAYNGIC